MSRDNEIGVGLGIPVEVYPDGDHLVTLLDDGQVIRTPRPKHNPMEGEAMPWLQFFNEEGEMVREFECSRMAKVMMDAGGTIVLDEGALDGPTSPRMLLLGPGTYHYAKSIADSERDKLKPSGFIADAGEPPSSPPASAPTEGLGPEPRT